MANAATVIVLAPDIKEELPVLYLRLRDAAVKKRTRIIEFAPRDTGITRYAWRSVRYQPGVAAAEIARTLADESIAAQIASGEVVVIAGRGNLAESQGSAVTALRAVLDGVPNASLLPALRRGNVVGALNAGLAPADDDHDALATLRAAADGKLDLLILLGADPIDDCPDADLARRALAGAKRVIAIDTFLSASSEHADVVLAAAGFGEHSGTTTNIEGRVQDVNQKVTVHGIARPDWMIAAELASALGHDLGFDAVAAVTVAASSRTPGGFAALESGAPPESAPNSYDYRLIVSRKLYDRAVGVTHAPSLAPLAIGAGAYVHPLDLDRVGVTDGTEVKLVGAHGSAVLALIADPSVQRGTVWAPFNQAGGNVAELIDSNASVTDIRIERLS